MGDVLNLRTIAQDPLKVQDAVIASRAFAGESGASLKQLAIHLHQLRNEKLLPSSISP